MKNTIVTLNCYVITFLCRALDWYRSSRISRTIQSITRPAALQYDDLIGDINKTIAKVTSLSLAGGQAEQRDMHDEMRQEYHVQENFRSIVQNRLDEMDHQLKTLVQQKYSEGDFRALHQQLQDVVALVKLISTKQTSSEQTLLQELVLMKQDIQATQASIRIEVSEAQVNQALAYISGRCAIDHQVVYEHALVQRKARRVTSGKCAPFWNSQQYQTWDRMDKSHVITLNSTLQDLLKVRDFCVGIVEQLITSHIPVFWIIQQRDHRNQKNQRHDIFEVLRSLIVQTLKAAFMHTDASQGQHARIRAFDAAASIEDYISLFIYSLSQFKLAYILVDTNAILPESIEDCHGVLLKLPELLREQNQDSTIKIMLLNSGLSRSVRRADPSRSAVVEIGQTSRRKSKRIPQASLRGNRGKSNSRTHLQ
jgi:hypothetical protein